LPIVAKLDVIEHLLDNNGLQLAGGKVYTYAASTTTPLATYVDNDGVTANQNPGTLDSSGRIDLWFQVGLSYKVIVKTSAGVTLKTVDGVGVAGTQTNAKVILTWTGVQPTASLWLGGERSEEALTFPANFSGSGGKKPKTLPTSSYVVTIKQVHAGSSTTIGTATCSTLGAWTFATTGGATVSIPVDDEIDFYGAGDTTVADFGLTLAGSAS
jgi:hypothetical protein